MKSLASHLESYLELRHRLGFKLRLAGGLLRRFVRFAQQRKARFISRKLALEWATLPADCQPAQWANRLGILRRFAQHVSAVDPRTEVPPQELLPHRYHRKPPYLYSDKEIGRTHPDPRETADPQRSASPQQRDFVGVVGGDRNACGRSHRAGP